MYRWKSPQLLHPNKVRQIGSDFSFLDCSGVVHHKFVTPVQTVRQQYYTDVLSYLQEYIWRKGKMVISWFIVVMHLFTPPCLANGSWPRTKLPPPPPPPPYDPASFKFISHLYRLFLQNSFYIFLPFIPMVFPMVTCKEVSHQNYFLFF